MVNFRLLFRFRDADVSMISFQKIPAIFRRIRWYAFPLFKHFPLFFDWKMSLCSLADKTERCDSPESTVVGQFFQLRVFVPVFTLENSYLCSLFLHSHILRQSRMGKNLPVGGLSYQISPTHFLPIFGFLHFLFSAPPFFSHPSFFDFIFSFWPFSSSFSISARPTPPPFRHMSIAHARCLCVVTQLTCMRFN